MPSEPSNLYSLTKLRQNLMHFGAGKVINGALGFVILLLLAQELPVPEYAAFVLFVAITRIAISFSSLGLESICLVYVPRYRANSQLKSVYSFITSLLTIRIATLLTGVCLLLLLSQTLTNFFDLLAWTSILSIYLWNILFIGLAEFWQVLYGALFLQKVAQRIWLVRNLIFFTLLGAHSVLGSTTLNLQDVIYYDLCASASSALIGFFELWLAWRSEAVKGVPAQKGWIAPSSQIMMKLGLSNYGNQVLLRLGDHHALLLLASLFLPTHALAALGFCLALLAQVHNYLPGMLFWRVIQPKLVANFSKTQDFENLRKKISLMYKGSLICLAPLLVSCITFGSPLLGLVSKDKYSDSNILAFSLFLALIPINHRFILSSLANILEQPRSIFLGSLTFLLTGPLTYLLLHFESGSLGIATALIITSLLYNTVVTYSLRENGFPYAIDFIGMGKIIIISFCTALITLTVLSQEPVLTHLMYNFFITCSTFVLMTYFLSPFTTIEKQLMIQLIPAQGLSWIETYFGKSASCVLGTK